MRTCSLRHTLGSGLAGALLAVFLASVPGVAQDAYPTRAVRLIVPFPPGPNDMLARLYGQKLTDQLGQPFVVESRPGATGTIGAGAVARAAPDGYTVLATVDLPMVKAPNLVPVPYDPVKELAPVAIVAEDFNVLAVHPSTGITSLAGFVAAAKAKPGALNFSSAGNGSPGHLCGEMVKGAAGIDMTHVPYQGAGPSLAALLGAEVQVFCGPPAALLPHIQAGKVTALGVTGEAASPLLPGLKPLSETWPSVVSTNWYGFFVPAGTPAAVTVTLAKALRQAFDDLGVRERLAAAAIESRWTDGAAATARIEADLAKWARVVKAANIKTN